MVFYELRTLVQEVFILRDKEIKQFIKENQQLFWYTPENKKEEISDELLLEMVINYSELDNILKLFNLMGLDRVEKTFKSFEGRKKNNIYPELFHFFKEYLKRAS